MSVSIRYRSTSSGFSRLFGIASSANASIDDKTVNDGADNNYHYITCNKPRI